ncbi:hypothetical protein YK56LOC_38580 [Caballeronia sp. HLA56]
MSAALLALDRLVFTVVFDGTDTDSVDAAIATVDAAIDATIADFPSHPLISAAVTAMKAECGVGLHEQSAIVKRSTVDVDGQQHTLH